MHVHIHCGHGEAKFWLAPEIELAQNYGLPKKDLTVIHKLIEEHKREIRRAWKKHFNR